MRTIHDAPPSDSGPWQTLVDDETDHVHIMPTYGRRHVFYPRCWCHPVSSPEEVGLVIHNVAH